MNIIDFGKLLKPLVERTQTELLSIAVNRQSAAVVLRPKMGVGPKRIQRTATETGIFPALFKEVGCSQAKIMTSGSFGSHFVTLKKRMPKDGWKVHETPTKQGRFTPLLAIEFSSTEAHPHHLNDFSNWGMLYYLLSVKELYFNGRQMTIKSRGFETNLSQHAFEQKFRTMGFTGKVIYDSGLSSLVVVQNEGFEVKEDYELPFAILLDQKDKEIENFDLFMKALGDHLHKKLMPAVVNQEEFNRNEVIGASKNKSLRSILESQAAHGLLGLLGYSTIPTVGNADFNPESGLNFQAVAYTRLPLVAKGVSVTTAAVLPDNIRIVPEELAPTYTNGHWVEVETINGAGIIAENHPDFFVQIVERININGIDLPFVYLLAENECLIDGELVCFADTGPFLLIAHQARSPRQLWMDLMLDHSFLLNLMASLNAQVNYHVFDLFDLALPDEQHDPFTMDEEVAAWLILSLNGAPYEGLQEFLSAVGDLLISTSFVETALETAGMNEETFSCRHKPKHKFWDCLKESRKELIEFLTAVDVDEVTPPREYKNLFEIGVKVKTERRTKAPA